MQGDSLCHDPISATQQVACTSGLHLPIGVHLSSTYLALPKFFMASGPLTSCQLSHVLQRTHVKENGVWVCLYVSREKEQIFPKVGASAE